MRIIVTMALIVSLCVVVLGCEDNDKVGVTQRFEAAFTETNQARLIQATQPPTLSKSLERENLKRRLLRFNDADKVSYIYLASNTGVIMAFMPIKGKVSSVNSKLTTAEQIVIKRRTGSWTAHVVESPQLDGSYGTNGNAIFFFTTEDVYVEWSGLYMLCDQPLKLSTPPLMVYQVEADEM